MPLAQLFETRQRVVHAPGARGRRDREQRIGHAAHRGHDDRGTAPIARPGRPNDVNQSLNRFRVSDRGTAEFLDNHKQQILYGKAGVVPVSAFVLVARASDDAIIAAGIRDDLAITPTEFVRFLAFAIEGGDRFFVLV